MNCKNCNTELPEGSVFCQKCGTKQVETQQVINSNQSTGGDVKKTSIWKIALIAGAAVIVLLIGIAVLTPDDGASKDKTLANNKAASSQTTAAQATQPAAQSAAQPAAAQSTVKQTRSTDQPAAKPAAIADTPELKNGFYKVTDKNGNYYEGNFVNDMKEGTGIYIASDGTRVEGQFSKNSITGYEKVKYPSGETYEGNMVNSQRVGYGIRRYVNGDIYEGNFVSNVCQDSNGKMTFKNGQIYQGGFANDKMNGQGTMYYSNGIYKGSFVNGVKSGSGRYDWESGSWYEGEWKNDKRNGQGTMYNSATGATDFGTWRDDVMVAAG